MSHKNSQVKPPVNQRVLALGIRSDALSTDDFPPGVATLEELVAMRKRSWAALQATGIDGEAGEVSLDPDEAEAELRRLFDGRSFGVVLIGGGIKNVPEYTVLFERIVNVLIELQPDIRLSFSTHPMNVLEALQRWLDR
ncbi:hypothetical protein ACSCB1_03355 [Streptomyces europaeiscabiei]|uniref:Uncharacterized protein n=1 Tax=Streptomyces europaeiscabiei TaxID=146819 RepID=A0ABU4NV68_9ACTN|nr:hypothetical protein [Streptomyces europaeiscabiei]MDX2524563.1 hypothetical protein [Streptomyces europaeiscabiei]MDX2772795.1 hypothetical protein [Streptomyces europaeiscabiei]MDX3548604.1 hypothetical protein [Streptomyces europaeiscabiei]MDX3558248.1 hypothetical protein [Streptomyces europaeiscabiei]MDX3672262.1 hypothetical protein [Streptomyces europaeiscabiei]